MTIVHDANNITISGTETGNSLRSYMVTNSLGTVTGRNIVFVHNLVVDAAATYTDDNFVYVFTDGHHINNTNSTDSASRPALIEFEDFSIVHTGTGPQSNSTVFTSNAITLRRGHMRVESASNRYDWFWQGITDYQMEDVIFDNQTTEDQINPFVFADGASLAGVKYLGATSGTRLQVGVETGGVATLSDWTISSNVADIPSTPSDDGTVRFVRTSWGNNTGWDAGISNRPLAYQFVNPRFPVAFASINFSGGSTQFVHYLRTHDVELTDGSSPIAGFPVRLYRSDLLSTDYTATTDGSGKIPQQEVLICDVTNDSTHTRYTDFQIRGYLYGYTPISGLRALQDLDDGIDEVVLSVVDNDITEPSSAVALAYTTTDNNAELYDHLAALLDRDQTTETALTCTAQGDFGSLDVTVDGTGSGEAVVSGSSVTFNSASFAGNLTTTGTVTLINGATVSGGIVDSVADSFLSFDGIDSWVAYTSEADRNADTNQAGSGTSATTFRFNFSGGTTYYLRLVAGGTTILQEVTPSAAGQTTVSLSTTALLSVVTGALGFIEQTVFCDTSLATNGTGSASSPYNSLDEAIAKARSINATRIRLTSVSVPAMPTVSLAGLKIDCSSGSTIVLSGQDCSSTEFDFAILTGSCTGTNTVLRSGALTSLSGYEGLIEHSLFLGDLTLGGNTNILECVDSKAVSEPVLDCNGQSCAVRGWSGTLAVTGVTTGSVGVDLHAGTVTLQAGNTGGAISVRGDCLVVDNSAGSTVTDATSITATIDGVWDEQVAGHSTAGSTGEAVQSSAAPSAADIYAEFTSGGNEDAFKADVSNLDVAVSTRSSHAAPDLSNLDVAVSTRSSHAAPDLSNLDVAVSTRSSHAAPDLSNLDVAVSSRLAGSAYTAPDNAGISANGTAIGNLNDVSAADVWSAATRTLTGDVTLSASERDAVATAVEQAILDEGDGQQVLNAIVGAIGNTNVDEVALVAAIRADLERSGGAIDLNADAIAALNDLSAAEVKAEADSALADYDAPTKAELDTAESNIIAAAGGAGLTQQQVRDAMKLAPTAGAPDAGSIDEELDEILADTSTIEPRVDVAVSSRSSHAAPDLSNLDVAVSTRSSHAAPDLSNLDVAVSTRSSHAAPDLSNLDVAVSTRSSHSAPDLSNLDVAVSSRSSHDAPDLSNLDVAVSSRLAGSAYTAPDNASAAAAAADAARARKRLTNRLEIEGTGTSNTQQVVYDDDGTTELERNQITTINGEDVVSGTGVPANRGAPT